jgi:hypothetical protein
MDKFQKPSNSEQYGKCLGLRRNNFNYVVRSTKFAVLSQTKQSCCSETWSHPTSDTRVTSFIRSAFVRVALEAAADAAASLPFKY